ncbi:DUF4349 domain-containing protein [Alkaliphilus sp. MSJ-5]|uniref:DUF4349 domain-containing protein n=1 Tax=Alkaliphilus flagellatus TaxID=2841507 RepID=A0ABS6G124_9FIRM|nr:DUF4349 domain-containing protein [Alkaliphilus flagellatus]
MRIKKAVVVPIISLLALVFVAFLFNVNNLSISKTSMENSVADMAIGSYPEMAAIEDEKLDFVSDNGRVEPSKVITNVHISLETIEFGSTTDNLNEIINKNKGYIEDSSISHNNYINNRIYKYAQYTIRVPKESMDSFINEISSIGNIVSQSTSKQDITKQYYDTESRLNVLKIKEERILTLLEKAEKIEDIIAIENQLSEIIYQKENLTKSILDMDDKVSYSTVSINISEVEKLTSGVTTETTFATKIANAFRDSLYFFKVVLEKFLITFIYVLPYFLIIGVIGILVYKFVRKKGK